MELVNETVVVFDVVVVIAIGSASVKIRIVAVVATIPVIPIIVVVVIVIIAVVSQAFDGVPEAR